MQVIWNEANIFSVFGGGYSQAARGYVIGLHRLGVDVKIEKPPVPGSELLSPDEYHTLLALYRKPRARVNKFVVDHTVPDYWARRGSYAVGFTYWETSRLPDPWPDWCRNRKAVWVSSQHNVDVFRSSGVDVPLFHIRPAISPPEPVSGTLLPSTLPPFRFFTLCTWGERKGYDVLLEAFWKTFHAHEPVCLVIKTFGTPGLEREIEQRKRRCVGDKPTPPVYVVGWPISHADRIRLFQECHAFVLPSRGEAVGYPLLEAAAMGLPVITTGWGGQTDFLPSDFAYFIPYRLVPVRPQPYYHGYQPNQLWAEPSVDALGQLMRHVYENYAEAKGRGERLRTHVLTHFTLEQGARDIVRAIAQLTGRSPV
jgi:Glycosyltransferase